LQLRVIIYKLSVMKKTRIIILVGLLFVLGIAGFLYSRQDPKVNEQTITPTITQQPSLKPTEKASSSVYVNPNAAETAIKNAVQKKSYENLNDYMADPVEVILYGSSCCGPLAKPAAIQQLTYLNSATTPWDFSKNSAAVKEIAANRPELIQNSIIGSSKNMIVIFTLNTSQVIQKIFIAPDYQSVISQP
jgi:hypothetical protein